MEEALLLSMIQKLDTVLPESGNRIKGKLKHITDELRMILEFLRETKLEERRRLNYFICDAIEMAHDALETEDTDGWFRSSFLTIIHGHLINTKNRMLQYKESPIRSENLGKGDDDGNVVGLDEDVKLLLRREILVDAQSFRALLITGTSGVGKTTLARQLYNHEDVVGRFERRAWVCVSDLSNKEVLMELIQQVVDSKKLERDSLLEKMERADNEGLQQMLRQHLQGMHSLIVLDDLPTQMRLKSILKALHHIDKKECRLLLTSCSKNIEWSLRCLPSFHYEMTTLDSNKSWKLFMETMSCGNKFTSEETFPKHLEKKGREVLMKTCEGLPLAIKEVGRQLAEKRLSGFEWDDLFESIDMDSTLELMESAYHKLNLEDKSCFLHLAFFKDNTSIRLQKLKHILVAIGMLTEAEAPYCCFYNLIRESIIEVKHKSHICDFGPKIFRMNVILHLLSVKKAKEEIGFEILSNNGKARPSQSTRHRVICCNREKFNYSTDQDKHLVSLLFHGGGCFDSSPSLWERLEQLKVLDLEDFGLKLLPESIGKLVELRYLGLRNNYIQELPNSLGCLKKLEVLDIALNYMVEVPNIVWEMSSLRHLYMSDVICRMPSKIHMLQLLMTLIYISVDNWTYELSGLQMMTSLGRLGIENFMAGNLDVSKLFVALAELQGLEHLMLRGSRLRSMPCLDQLGILRRITNLKLEGLLHKLPSAENFPPTIQFLKLVNSCLDEDPMPVLEKLPVLVHLKLRNAYTGQQMVISLHNGFRCLGYLYIEELWNLRNVEVGKDALPSLQKLEINNCPHLETLPKDIGSIDELKMVTTKRIATKIRKSGSIPNTKHVDISP